MTTSASIERAAASFRDPSGFIFRRDGVLYRQVNRAYRPAYEALMASGLYARLVEKGALVAHEEVDLPAPEPALADRILRPEPLPFISYPYEWSFSQLKDAALLTLRIARRALAAGMTLKDASAYNIQFRDGRPVLIDTLSFDLHREGEPWEAYRQFCRHFLAPLALAAHVDVRLTQLLRANIDGVPLDLAARLLPAATRLDLTGLGLHIHTHARVQERTAASPASGGEGRKMSRKQLGLILEGLEATVEKLKWKPAGTEWGDYYQATNYSDEALRQKAELTGRMLAAADPRLVWDIGANNGYFSRIAAGRGAFTVSSDIDPVAVEKNYLQVKAEKEKNLLPLLIDLTNPSPAIGWENRERSAFLERGPADLTLALALIHHLAIANNLPLAMLARFFAVRGKWALIEFVPKADSQVQRLLAARKDIFDAYDEPGFEAAFGEHFTIVEKTPIPGTVRTLYLLRGRA